MNQTEPILSCEPKRRNVPLPLVPFLTVPSAKEAHTFYSRAFGAESCGKVEPLRLSSVGRAADRRTT